MTSTSTTDTSKTEEKPKSIGNYIIGIVITNLDNNSFVQEKPLVKVHLAKLNLEHI